MGQEEVIKILEKHNKPIPRRQIAKESGEDPIKISHHLQKLLKRKEIKCIELDRIQAGKMLCIGRPFRRTRFYYL